MTLKRKTKISLCEFNHSQPKKVHLIAVSNKTSRWSLYQQYIENKSKHNIYICFGKKQQQNNIWLNSNSVEIKCTNTDLLCSFHLFENKSSFVKKNWIALLYSLSVRSMCFSMAMEASAEIRVCPLVFLASFQVLQCREWSFNRSVSSSLTIVGSQIQWYLLVALGSLLQIYTFQAPTNTDLITGCSHVQFSPRPISEWSAASARSE